MDGPLEFLRATDDPDVAEDLLRNEGGEWALLFAGASEGRPFDFSSRQLLDQNVTVAMNTAQARFDAVGTSTVFGVVTLTSGTFDWEVHGERGRGIDAPFLMHPDRPMFARIDAMELINVYVPTGILQETSRQLYGTEDDDLDFAAPTPVDEEHGRYFGGLARFAASAIDSGAFQHPLTRAALTRNLTVGILECFIRAGDRRSRAESASRRARLYREGVDFLRAHASLPITADDAAVVLGCTLADLDSAFVAHAMMPAREYLHRLRITAAHEELLVGDEASTRVSDVAHRWGFPSVADFATRYERAYGRSPRETLRD